ncbi:SDR family NAD(P)-dependent oxidoreductase [Paenibacillus prosopidis]|uniref:NAD(P)-dependent dehydrogenase (Short-subunit alcohol dehydrogenase family) n=1 Tax=Paenibacillus prosopidis TaxID=630520 RepID=A0A368VPQ9_9BACL|nr:SDR family NAD(P)-dependent oxidoreductase [Paenibacillus prosopidis]RCW42995.1 NAD(P)-dependent dehydrogenase (short-subunit alcohol dehydrogenase family) [Paenibacillus prosopidis]
MRTIVITGGTDGIGRQLALHYLRNGERVFVIGRSSEKGKGLQKEAVKLVSEERFIFLQADLSMISENIRVVEEVSKRVKHIDLIIFCAQSQKFSKIFRETEDGIEFHFALYYLSRFILSYQFRNLLIASTAPLIVNVCAPGVKGEIKWNDLQLQTQRPFNSIKAIMHGSRLNDMLGAAFAQSNGYTNIKYVLYNPGAVQTKGAMEAFDQKMMKILVKFIYRIIGQPVEKAVEPIINIIDFPAETSLTAYKLYKKLDIPQSIVNNNQSEKLLHITLDLIEQKHGKLNLN